MEASEPQQKTIHLSYYALLKESCGLSEESYTTYARTADMLYNEIAEKHAFRIPIEKLRVSVNDSFSSWQSEIRTGDRIVFIPPVSGG